MGSSRIATIVPRYAALGFAFGRTVANRAINGVSGIGAAVVPFALGAPLYHAHKTTPLFAGVAGACATGKEA